MASLFQPHREPAAKVPLHPLSGETEWTQLVAGIESLLLVGNKYLVALTKMVGLPKPQEHKLEATLRDARLVPEKLNSLLARLQALPKYHLGENEKSVRRQRESRLKRDCKSFETELDQVTKDVHKILKRGAPSISESEISEEEEPYQRNNQLQSRMQEDISNDLDHLTAVSKDRYITIHSIERQTKEVHEVMKDLNDLVHQQKPLLELIESRIEVARNDVQSGVDDLQKAELLQQKKRKRLCCIMLMLMIGLIIFVLFIIAMLRT